MRPTAQDVDLTGIDGAELICLIGTHREIHERLSKGQGRRVAPTASLEQVPRGDRVVWG